MKQQKKDTAEQTSTCPTIHFISERRQGLLTSGGGENIINGKFWSTLFVLKVEGKHFSSSLKYCADERKK